MDNLNSIKDKFAVLVVSCDKYSDLWKPFFQLFWRFWPDCPFKVYLLSNHSNFSFPGVNNILVGDDVSWSDNLKNALKQIEEQYVLLFIDDLFLVDFVNNEKILKVFKWMADNATNYVRMNPTVKPDKPFNELVGLVSKGTIYRTSTVMSAWKRKFLLELLKEGESAWDFEIYGAVRSDFYDGFYSTWENHFPVINGVIKGKWQKKAVRKINDLGINIDTEYRKIMNLKEAMILFYHQQRSRLLNFMPAKYRRKIKEIAFKGNFKY